MRAAGNPLYMECEGLEWETPDRFMKEIQTEGYEEWKRRFQSLSEWKRRVKLLRDFIDSALTL